MSRIKLSINGVTLLLQKYCRSGEIVWLSIQRAVYTWLCILDSKSFGKQFANMVDIDLIKAVANVVAEL